MAEKIPEIRFKGFENEWDETNIGSVTNDLYNGQTPSRFNESFWKGEINWLTSGELNRATVTKTIEQITKAGQENANLRLVPPGTFIMAITGLEAKGTRGNCAILGLETTLNQSCMAIFPKANKLISSFLFQWYRRNSEELGVKYTQGTKQQSFNAELIRKLDIILPKTKEQTQIGNYFQQLDKLIHLHQKKIRQAGDSQKSHAGEALSQARHHHPRNPL